MVKIYKTEEILKDFSYHIDNKVSWGLLRLGDGGIKFLHSIIFNDDFQLKEIVKKEGIPYDRSFDILDLWTTSANICNYIDTPEVYFSDKFWDRVRKGRQQMHEDTIEKMKDWKKLHILCGFTNKNYCNPEINFLSCLDIFDKSLIEILDKKRICCITSHSYKKVNECINLSKKIDVVQICKNDEDHFHNCFDNVINIIEKDVKKYDVWLVAAGELGRIYTGLIKYKGSISFDLGSVIDYWCSNIIPLRLFWFIRPSSKHKLKLSLTKDGKFYRGYI